MFSRGQKTAFEKWPVFGLILTYVLKTECSAARRSTSNLELTGTASRYEYRTEPVYRKYDKVTESLRRKRSENERKTKGKRYSLL